MKRYIKSSKILSSLNNDEYPSWSAYDKYQDIYDRYLPEYGQGDNRASQIVVAVSNIVYGWDNDKSVYDNHWKDGIYDSYTFDDSLCCHANWLYRNAWIEVGNVLTNIFDISSEKEYEKLLKILQKTAYSKDVLSRYENLKTRGDVYSCAGPFTIDEPDDEDW